MIQAFHSMVVARKNAGGGGGGPTLIASDDFSWATGAVLIGSDADWTTVAGSIVASSGQITGASTAATSVSFFDSIAALLNQRAEITLKAFNGAFIGVACRVVDTNNYYYAISNGSVMYAGVNVGGSVTNFVGGTSIAYSVNDKLAMEVTGTAGATVVTIQRYTGGAWSNVYSGDPGAYMNTAGNPGVCAYSDNCIGDDFAAYSL